jgi:hypothetical protein
MASHESLVRLLNWFLYYVGVALYVLGKARGSIASRGNSVTRFRDWWELNWRELGWVLVGDGLAFVLWDNAPQLFGAMVGKVIPLTYGTAPVVGAFVHHWLNTEGFTRGFIRVDMTQVAPPKEVQSADGAPESPRS